MSYSKEKKQWYSITNSLVFAIVMKDETLCIELLNRILPNRKVKAIRFPEPLNVVDSAVEQVLSCPDRHGKSETWGGLYPVKAGLCDLYLYV